jgi:hypothetical protein
MPSQTICGGVSIENNRKKVFDFLCVMMREPQYCIKAKRKTPRGSGSACRIVIICNVQNVVFSLIQSNHRRHVKLAVCATCEDLNGSIGVSNRLGSAAHLSSVSERRPLAPPSFGLLILVPHNAVFRQRENIQSLVLVCDH